MKQIELHNASISIVQTTIPLTSFPGGNSLLNAYAAGSQQVSPWFHYSPHNPAAVAQRLAALEADPMLGLQGALRGPLVAAIVAQQQRWGAGSLAQAAARQLGRERTYTVLTGQQAGLFGGPLYTVLKALSVIKLARQLKQQHSGFEFVPVFWIASGDSDYEEIRHCYLSGPRGETQEVALPPEAEADRRKLLASREVVVDIEAALTALGECLPPGPHREAVYAAVRAAYNGQGLVDGFARWLARLFTDTELVLVDFQDPVLKSSASNLFRQQLTGAAELEQRLTARDAEITAAGFPLQAQWTAGDTALFFSGPQDARDKIARDGQDFLLRGSGRRMLRDELLAIAANSPEWLVPGVMSLPVVQNNLFPMAAWVGGGAEIAYRAQATAVFDFHGQRMAPAYLRASATLLSAKEAKLLDGLGWELPQLYTVPQEIAARAVADDMPTELTAALTEYRRGLLAADGHILPLVEAIDPNLGKTMGTFRDNLEKHADKVEKKILSALKSQRQALVSRIELLHQQVYPRHAAQERVLSVLNFLPRHGFELIPRLLEQINVPAWQHQVIILD
jgi:bacillithiol synthase